MVGYLRVSTANQGASGLGLEGQELAIAQHVATNGCKLLASYIEVETGKKDDLNNRPMLQKALAHAKRSGATLVVAKLDRLARSVAVTSALHTSGVDFVCCDNPNANRMTIQILAVMAEFEAKQISERTKDALAAAKARGIALGASNLASRNLTPEARQRGSQATRARVATDYAEVGPIVLKAHANGQSLRAIAAMLNDSDYVTPRGKTWTATQITRIVKRAAAIGTK